MPGCLDGQTVLEPSHQPEGFAVDRESADRTHRPEKLLHKSYPGFALPARC